MPNNTHLPEPQAIESIFVESGLRIAFRENGKDDWTNVLNKCNFIKNEYTSTSIDYQLAYQTGHGGRWIDISALIFFGDNLAGAWPITISEKNDLILITSQGQKLVPPIFDKNLTTSAKRELTRRCFDFAHKLAIHIGITNFVSCDSFADTAGLSEWHIEAMSRGATCEIQHDIYTKTTGPMEEIQKGFRRTLRDRIKQGQKLWKCNTLSSKSGGIDSVWREFQSLHLRVSGRTTRSEESWENQKKAIVDNKAFLIFLRDDHQAMIGGGYFTVSRDEGLYAVAAYERSLFDKPVGHLVQFEAIKEFIERGIRWYKVGHLPFLNDKPEPTEKELSIGHFKKQFSSHIFPKFIFNTPTRNGLDE